MSFGTEESITHKPKLKGDRGIIMGFYAVAKLKGGGTQFEFMSASDINKIRDGSQGYKMAVRHNKQDTPWIANYEAMGRKSAIRRLCNYLPMSVELANAVALEGRAERNESQGLEGALDGEFTIMPDDAPAGAYNTDTGEVNDPVTGELIDGDGVVPPKEIEHQQAMPDQIANATRAAAQHQAELADRQGTAERAERTAAPAQQQRQPDPEPEPERAPAPRRAQLPIDEE